MSVKRKTNRVQTGMKMIGIKSVDELFKIATLPLIKFIEIRIQFESALVIFLYNFFHKTQWRKMREI